MQQIYSGSIIVALGMISELLLQQLPDCYLEADFPQLTESMGFAYQEEKNTMMNSMQSTYQLHHQDKMMHWSGGQEHLPLQLKCLLE